MFKRIHSLLNVFVIISLAVPWTSVTPAQPALAASAPQEASASTGIFRTRVTLTDPTSRARLDKLGVTVLSEAPQPPTPGEPVPFGIGGTGEPIPPSIGGAGGPTRKIVILAAGDHLSYPSTRQTWTIDLSSSTSGSTT